MQLFVILISALCAQGYSTNTYKSLPPTLPYYQPIQSQPSYKILSNKPLNPVDSTAAGIPNTAAIFTKEEFPRDLLEIAQKKLGLKSLEEVPSITELAELLGTNNVNETINYVRHLTATEQGIALMKAYIESSDYTDRTGGTKNQTTAKVTAPKTTTKSTQNIAQLGFLDRMAAFLNIYNVEPQHKQIMEQQLRKISAAPLPIEPNALRNMRPMYVRNPLPYHYPIPLRPLTVNRTALRKQFNQQIAVAPETQQSSSAPHHLNTSKKLSPSFIQQLARIANVSPKKLESFLKQKPKFAELAIQILRSSRGHEHNPHADSQLFIAVRKVMEQDEDLKKLLSVNTLL